MIILLNMLLALILTAIVSVGYFVYKKNNKISTIVITVVIAILVTIIYSSVQPSYLPKGKAKPMQAVPLETYEKLEIKDISIKALPKEQRQERFDEIITVRKEVKAILDK